MTDSIFTKIIKGEIPCHKVYEDDKSLAFLDIFPIVPGHVLVVSKKQVEYLWDLPDEDYQAVMAACKKVANRLREVLKVKYVGVKVVGTDVPHVHIHLVPFNHAKEYYKRRGLNQVDDTELANLAAKLAL
ncbi:HIT domain-containing protein [Candidatus Saccharibacteria bacterium]|nr:HIT domain-containing protein [Candidatus Saccharibacteria bacterium]